MATEQQLKAYFAASHRNWDQLCQAMAYNTCRQFGHVATTYGSAKIAYQHSRIESRDASKAPAGSFHYWDIGTYGHVAVGLGGQRVAMASRHIDTRWGINVGVTTVNRYTLLTGARYLGWSHTNGVNDFTLAIPAPSTAAGKDRTHVRNVARYLNGQHLGRTTTAADDGVRGPNYRWLVQAWGRKHGRYPAPLKVDGVFGTQSRKVEQTLIKEHG